MNENKKLEAGITGYHDMILSYTGLLHNYMHAIALASH